jgi:hypothetical protein
MEWKSQVKRSVLAGILALGLLAASHPASAADSSGRMGVGITILPICHIGTHPSTSKAGQVTPEVTIRCARGTTYGLDVVPPTLQAAPGEAGVTWVTISF